MLYNCIFARYDRRSDR